MKRLISAAVAAWLGSIALLAQSTTTGPPARESSAAPTADAATQTVKQYCAGCHSERAKAGGLSLADFDVTRAGDHAEIAEKVIRKLTAGLMPPGGARRPDDATLEGVRRALEARVDQWAAAHPNPGWRPFQRLTRAEYAQ